MFFNKKSKNTGKKVANKKDQKSKEFAKIPFKIFLSNNTPISNDLEKVGSGKNKSPKHKPEITKANDLNDDIFF